MTDEAKEVKLSQKQTAFIDAYLSGDSRFDATNSARAAGYKDDQYLHTNANKLLRNTTIKAEIDRRLDEVRMSKPEVLQRISDIARGDMGEFLDIGSMGFSLDLNGAKEKGLTKLIKKVKQKTTIFLAKKESDEDREVHETEIELYSALDALGTVAKHHGLLKDTVALQNPDGTNLLPQPETMKPSEIAAEVVKQLAAIEKAVKHGD